MWADGWSPEHGNLDLFATDFGAIFAEALLRLPEMKLIMRSADDLNHLSVWSERSKAEYFPLHKVVKCLRSQNGESLSQLFKHAQDFNNNWSPGNN